jgi:hypothetical protein
LDFPHEMARRAPSLRPPQQKVSAEWRARPLVTMRERQLQTVAHAFAELSNTGLGQHGPPPPHAPLCASSSRQSAQRPDTPRIRERHASKHAPTSALHAGSALEQIDVQMG